MPDGSGGGGDGGGLLVHGGCLREAVADAILRVDRRLGLPVWLLQLFTVRRLGCGLPGVWTAWGVNFRVCGLPVWLLQLFAVWCLGGGWS